MVKEIEEQRFGPLRLLPAKNRGRYPFCNCLFVEGAGIIFDPSSGRDRLSRLQQEVPVNAVCLTHWHEDHWRHFHLFKDVPLWISEKDAPPHQDIECYLDWYGIDLAHRELRDAFREFILQRFSYRPRTPERCFSDGDIIDLGITTMEVIGTPGHSPGHLSFFFPEQQLIFLGDYLLTPFGPWYGDPYSQIEDTLISIERLRQIPAKIWIAGHGNGLFKEDTTKFWERYIKIMRKREERLLRLLSEAKTFDEIVKTGIVLGRPKGPKGFLELREAAIMRKHLDRLIAFNRVIEEQGRYLCVGQAEATM